MALVDVMLYTTNSIIVGSYVGCFIVLLATFYLLVKHGVYMELHGSKRHFKPLISCLELIKFASVDMLSHSSWLCTVQYQLAVAKPWHDNMGCGMELA